VHFFPGRSRQQVARPLRSTSVVQNTAPAFLACDWYQITVHHLSCTHPLRIILTATAAQINLG